jgi:hypothetical protein
MDKSYIIFETQKNKVVKTTQLSVNDWICAQYAGDKIVDITNPIEPLLLVFEDEDNYTWKHIE